MERRFILIYRAWASLFSWITRIISGNGSEGVGRDVYKRQAPDNPLQPGFESCALAALQARETVLSSILDNYRIPSWFTMKDFLSAACDCPFTLSLIHI